MFVCLFLLTLSRYFYLFFYFLADLPDFSPLKHNSQRLNLLAPVKYDLSEKEKKDTWSMVKFENFHTNKITKYTNFLRKEIQTYVQIREIHFSYSLCPVQWNENIIEWFYNEPYNNFYKLLYKLENRHSKKNSFCSYSTLNQG